ncbi:MAG: IS200/IS605 family transposase, partial [Solobacterium sp.]|jgi:putative transposase|nr:IS200/IS605 family transposase [Solobacterium sp.]MCI1408258.1 IS200/IS605 family transposase [Solobacterium sp.]
VDIQEMEVMPDHVHLLCSFKPKYSITDVVKNLKGASARLFLKVHPEIRKAMFWKDRLWAPSCYVDSVGNMSKETIKRYILNQYDGKGGDYSPEREKESNSSPQ